MTDLYGPHPADPFLTPEQQLMVELGWMELWHALREEQSIRNGRDPADDG